MGIELRGKRITAVGLVALALVWGTQFLIIKSGQATLPPLTTAMLRFAVLTAAAQLAILITRPSAPVGTRLQRTSFGFTLAVSFGLLYWAQSRIPAALAGVLSATTPLFIALLACRFVAGEGITLARAAALGVGFGGVTLIVVGAESTGGEPQVLAVLAVLTGAIASAANKVLAKQLTGSVPAPILLRDMGLVVTIVIGIAALAFERHLPMEFTSTAVFSFVYLGLVASFAASGLYLILLRRYAVSSLAYLQFATAAVAAVVGTLVGGERMSASLAGGVAAVLVGLFILASSTSV